MDIEESKELLKKELVNTYSEKKAEAIDVLLNELDKDNNIISDLQNEATLKQCELDKKDNDIDILLNRIDEYEKNTMWKYDVKEALDKKDKIIDILLNEAAKDGTPSEFEYRKKRILEICKEKAEGK